jgi:hypothetical protein
VAQLVHRCRALLKALECVGLAVLLLGLRASKMDMVSSRPTGSPKDISPRRHLRDHLPPATAAANQKWGCNTHKVELELRKLGVHLLDSLLAVDEVHGEAVDGVVKGDALAAAGRVGQLVDVRRLRLLRQDLDGLFQLGEGLDSEGGAAKLGLGGGLDAEDKGLGPIAAVICPRADALGLEEAKVDHEKAGGVHLLRAVLVVDMGDVVEFDLVRVCHVG